MLSCLLRCYLLDFLQGAALDLQVLQKRLLVLQGHLLSLANRFTIAAIDIDSIRLTGILESRSLKILSLAIYTHMHFLPE